MTEKEFNTFTQSIKHEIVSLIEALQKEAGLFSADIDDCESESTSLDITISINKDATTWSYQTGDNSFVGSCYGDPYWGVTSFTKICDPSSIADYLLDDLANQINFDKE